MSRIFFMPSPPRLIWPTMRARNTTTLYIGPSRRPHLGPPRIVRGLLQAGQSTISLVAMAGLLCSFHWAVALVLCRRRSRSLGAIAVSRHCITGNGRDANRTPGLITTGCSLPCPQGGPGCSSGVALPAPIPNTTSTTPRAVADGDPAFPQRTPDQVLGTLAVLAAGGSSRTGRWGVIRGQPGHVSPGLSAWPGFLQEFWAAWGPLRRQCW